MCCGESLWQYWYNNSPCSKAHCCLSLAFRSQPCHPFSLWPKRSACFPCCLHPQSLNTMRHIPWPDGFGAGCCKPVTSNPPLSISFGDLLQTVPFYPGGWNLNGLTEKQFWQDTGLRLLPWRGLPKEPLCFQPWTGSFCLFGSLTAVNESNVNLSP